MKNFDTRTYSIIDFIEWDDSNLLNLSPDFQRRAVWSEIAKSYLIDTIIRGKPIPKVIIKQELKESRNIRVVVDGQQRIRTILEYYNDSFTISRAHNRELAGKRFSSLSDDKKNEFKKYEIGVDVLFDVTYEDTLDIFARLNTYSLRLKKQEQFNAKYLGYFKQLAYRLGYRYVGYWKDAGIMSVSEISRMQEAEFASDLSVALLDGIQSKIQMEKYYKDYEEESGNLDAIEIKFDNTMTYIGELYTAIELKATIYSKRSIFYSLFCSIAHSLYGIKNMEDSERPSITKRNLGRIRVRLDEISGRYENNDESKDYQEFIENTKRSTTDASRRIARSKFLCKKIEEALRG